MKHMERIWPGFVVFVYVSCRIVVCNVEVYFRLYETELYKPHYKSTNYTYKWHVNCFMKKATGGVSFGRSSDASGTGRQTHRQIAPLLCFYETLEAND